MLARLRLKITVKTLLHYEITNIHIYKYVYVFLLEKFSRISSIFRRCDTTHLSLVFHRYQGSWHTKAQNIMTNTKEKKKLKAYYMHTLTCKPKTPASLPACLDICEFIFLTYSKRLPRLLFIAENTHENVSMEKLCLCFNEHSQVGNSALSFL